MLANTTHPTTSMSSDFFAALATTIDMQEQPQFLADMFGGDISVSGEFERTAYLLARNISDSYNPCGFSFAKCKQYDTFFMYPTDSSKQYAVEDFDEDEDEYGNKRYYHVDNKVFGMIVTLRALEDSSCRKAGEEKLAGIIYDRMERLYQAISHTTTAMCSDHSKLNEDEKAHVRYMASLIQKHVE